MVPEFWLSLLHIAVIGNTGVGKSSLCNYMSGIERDSTDAYPVSEGVDAFTNRTTAHVVKFLGDGPEFVLVDTPGLNDASGKDSLHIAEMVEELKQLVYMNSFLILFNSQQPRFDESLKAMIQIFTQIFGRERFFDNVILVFTRWEHTPAADDKRKRTGETRISREREFNNYFRKEFGVARQLPCVFVDAYPNPENEAEVEANEREVLELKKLTENMKPYPLENAEVVRGYLDQLEDQKKEEAERADRAEKEAKANAAAAAEERQGRQDDKEQFDLEIKTKEQEHQAEVAEKNRLRAEAEKALEVERAEHQRREAEHQRALEEERRRHSRRRRRRRGWGVRIDL